MARDYPVGKAQQMVLDALNITAKDFSEAEKVFKDLGLVVTSKRQGRSSVPVIEIKDRFGGGFNAAREGVTYREHQDHDFSAIEQWIE